MSTHADVAVDAKAALGEGAFWDVRTGHLHWVDIEGKTLHLYDPATGRNTSRTLVGRPGTVVPRKQPGVVVAVEQKVCVLDSADATPRELCAFTSEPEGNRLNDGKCDPAGRLWVGTMSGDRSPNGTLYCVEPDGSYRAAIADVTISNGIVWTADESTMYYIDTPTGCVQAFDYDGDEGAISNARTAFAIPESMGHPDGMTIDSQGMLWIALFRGSAVRRFNPADGTVLATVELPASNVTSCSLGGGDLRDLYITTARIGLSDEQRGEQPLAGGLFCARVEVPGVAGNLFAG